MNYNEDYWEGVVGGEENAKKINQANSEVFGYDTPGTNEWVAGGLDHAAGSMDEAFARSFDDNPGGGLWDGFAGGLDHAAGNLDESFARQFDDKPGGGFGDELLNLLQKPVKLVLVIAFLLVLVQHGGSS